MAASEKPEKTASVYMVARAAASFIPAGRTTRKPASRPTMSGKGAAYPHPYRWALFTEACGQVCAALRREIALKKLTKAQKEALCAVIWLKKNK